jgi:hypothetical protein
VSDELGFGFGWKGGTDGAVDRALGHFRGQRTNQVALGKVSAATLQVTGEITAQYGGAGFNFFFVDKLGESEQQPLILNIRDYGWTGPNELGKPVGVALDKPKANEHPIKSDGLGQEISGWRHVLVRQQDQWGRNKKIAHRVWFAENAKCDDIPNCDGTYTTETSWTYVNADGDHYYQNGTHVDDRVGGNRFQGDGKSPAMIGGKLVLVHRDSARFGRFHDISIETVTDNGPPYFDHGRANSIDSVTLSGRLRIAASPGSNSAQHLTFLGASREVINVGSGSTLTLKNVCAPSGSTIGGAGKVVLSGRTLKLPYKLQAGDCTKRMADVPANPFFTGGTPTAAPLSAPTNLRVVDRSVPAQPAPTEPAPPEPAPQPSGMDLVYSTVAARDDALPLGGATVSGDIFAFLRHGVSIQRVQFYIDGQLVQTENSAPYDLAGGSVSAATPFATTGLADGEHEIEARITLANGSSTTTRARFNVQNTAPAPAKSRMMVSFKADRSAAKPLEGRTVSGEIYPFLESDVPVTQVRFYIDGTLVQTENLPPYDLAGGTDATANPYSTKGLADGTHELEARITLADGSTSTASARFIVGNTAPAPAPADVEMMVSFRADRGAAQSLDGLMVSGEIYPFLGYEVPLTRVAFYINGTLVQTEQNPPYDLAGGSASTAAAVDTRKLRNGRHQVRAVATLQAGGTKTAEASFQVRN